MVLHVVCWKVRRIYTKAKIAILTPRARKKEDFPGTALMASLGERILCSVDPVTDWREWMMHT